MVIGGHVSRLCFGYFIVQPSIPHVAHVMEAIAMACIFRNKTSQNKLTLIYTNAHILLFAL